MVGNSLDLAPGRLDSVPWQALLMHIYGAEILDPPALSWILLGRSLAPRVPLIFRSNILKI